jgi:hypothetical protein
MGHPVFYCRDFQIDLSDAGIYTTRVLGTENGLVGYDPKVGSASGGRVYYGVLNLSGSPVTMKVAEALARPGTLCVAPPTVRGANCGELIRFLGLALESFASDLQMGDLICSSTRVFSAIDTAFCLRLREGLTYHDDEQWRRDYPIWQQRNGG